MKDRTLERNKKHTLVGAVDSNLWGPTPGSSQVYVHHGDYSATYEVKISDLREMGLGYGGAPFKLVIDSSGRRNMIPDEEKIREDEREGERAIREFLGLGDEE